MSRVDVGDPGPGCLRLAGALVCAALLFGCSGSPAAPSRAGEAPPACADTAAAAPDERRAASFVVQDGISQIVNVMAMSQDGRVLAGAESHGVIRVWDTRAGLLLRRLKARGSGNKLELSRDGARLAFSEEQEMERDPSAVVVVDLDDASERRIAPYGAFAFTTSDGASVAVGHDGVIAIHDTKTGAKRREIRVTGAKGPAGALAVDAAGRRCAVSFGGEVFSIDLERAAVLGRWVEPAGNPGDDPSTGAPPPKIAGMPEIPPIPSELYWMAIVGDDIVAQHSSTRVLVYPAGGGARRLALPGPYMQVAADGRRLWTLSHPSGKLAVLDLRTGKAIEGPAIPDPFRLAASPDGGTIALSMFHPIEGNTIRLLDGATLRAVRTIEGRASAVQAIAADPTGKELAVGNFQIAQWGLGDGELRASTPPNQIAGVDALVYTPDGKLLLSTEGRFSRVREAGTGRLIRSWRRSDRGGTGFAAFRPGTRELVTGEEEGDVLGWDLADAKAEPAPRKIGDVGWEIEHGDVAPDGQWLALLGRDGHLAVMAAAGGAVRWQAHVPTVHGVTGVAFTPDGRRVLMSRYELDLEATTPPVPELRVFDAATGAHERTLDPGTVGPIARRGATLAIGGSHPVLLDGATLATRASIATRDFLITAIAPHPMADAFVLGGESGAATVVSARTGAVAAVMLSTPSGEYVTAAPEGWYRSSLDGARSVGWAFGRPLEGYSFEQFAARLERPDVVATRLSLQDGPPPPPIHRPPRVELDPSRHAAEVATSSFAVHAAVASSGRVDRVRVFVNGRPAAERAVCAPRADVDLEVALPVGRSRVSVVAYDADGFASNPRALDVVSTARAPRPDLWVVAVGVSRYPALSPDEQLDVADDDARALTAALSKLAGERGPFGHVHTTTLVDGEATVAAIERALGGLSGMRPDDLAVVFLAGHGVKLGGGEMVFLTGRAGKSAASARAEGLGYAGIQNALARASGRVLMLLDACHSGHVSVERVAPNEELARELAAKGKSGVLVFAASRGAQLSYEVAGGGGGAAGSRGLELAWDDARPRLPRDLPSGHGLFTSAVLSALAGEATDRDKSGAIEASELIDHVTERVRAASNGKQTPWVARREIFGDFAIAPAAPAR